ncbi:beta-lactamase family [Fusarium subglutinans]|uniref:Actin-like protein ARP6 n=1 Tax=Gibberella subglutinans TaxID=42677 RepID=A0A8H5PET5_GIBSU|nr:beta-lactamase family [Fusarium subglutinans]KAF5595274.1 beta-lactamase family [Fusarium subglutinans]
MKLSYSIVSILPLAAHFISAELRCRPEGAVLPRPTALTKSPIFTAAATNLTETLNAALSGSITAGWPTSNVSFSLAVVSADQDDPGVPIWEYHHLAAANTKGTKRLDRDSQYLIGSITKVFTDYLLLKSGMDLDAPVTEYLPGLDGKSKIRWRDVSLRMLASYLGGTPANYGFSDFYLLKEVFLAYGFPPIDDDDYPTCGVIGLNRGCTGQDMLSGMRESYPQTTPNERPAYSNMAFILLGMALEEYTGNTYAQLLEEVVSCPLDMKDTFPSPGDDDKAVIPPGDSSWGSDYKLNTPAGGLVSSLSDLSKFSHALLSRTLNMTSTEINGWLKPNAFAGNAYTLTGMPWEILRLSNLTPDHPHAVTVYGKSGGAQNYRSQLSFVDDYGLAIIILTAGPMKAAPILTNAMLSTFIDVADEVSREQVKRYEQRYMSDHQDDVPIEAALAQDNGLMILASLHRNGTDVLSSITDIWGLTLGDFLPGVGPKIRVFPSQLRKNATLDGETVVKEVWHLWPDLNSGFETGLPGNWIEEMNCVGWSIQDWVHYGAPTMAGPRKSKPAPPKGPSTTLVLDNGASTIKAGLIHSSTIPSEPRIIPNVIARDRTRKVYVASELEKCRDFGEIQFRRPVEKGFIVNWEAQKEIWDREIFEREELEPKDARLILAEPPNGLPILQANCDQIVFEEYGFASYYRGIGSTFNAYHDVQNIFRTPQEAPTVANTPAEAVMVIDSGYSHTTITPVLRGQPLQSAIKRLDVGGKVLTNYLTRLISLRHFDMRNDTYIVNEMKELSCYVSADFKADLEKSWKGTRGERRPDYLSGGGIAKDYILPDFHTRFKGTLVDYDPARHSKARKLAAQSEEDALTLRNERFAVPEILFNPSDAGIRQPGLADLVYDSLQELPIGLWPALLANIIVVGGNTHFDGFIQRLQKEVVQRVPDDCIVRVARPADPVTHTWFGGANLACHTNIEGLAVTKAEYEEHGASWVAKKFAAGLGT